MVQKFMQLVSGEQVWSRLHKRVGWGWGLPALLLGTGGLVPC